MNRGQSLCLAGGVALLFGAFLPWATVQSLVLGVSRSMAGYQGDSIVAGGIGLAILLVSLLAKGTAGKRYSVAAVILALVAGFVVAIYLPAAANATKPGSAIVVTSGPGLYLSLIGCVLALVGGMQVVPGGAVAIQPAAQIPVVAPAPVATVTTPQAKPSRGVFVLVVVAPVILLAVLLGVVVATDANKAIVVATPDPVQTSRLALASPACLDMLRQQFITYPAPGPTPDLAASRNGDDYTVTGIVVSDKGERWFVTCNMTYDGKEFKGTVARR